MSDLLDLARSLAIGLGYASLVFALLAAAVSVGVLDRG